MTLDVDACAILTLISTRVELIFKLELDNEI